MDKVIITGASGFIGKNLVELLESKYEVIKLSNLSDYQFVLDKLTGIGKVKAIVHLASTSTTKTLNTNNHTEIARSYLSTLNLLQAIHSLKEYYKYYLIYASSATVYSNEYLSHPYLFDTVNPYDDKKEKLLPDSVYGLHKLACESLIRFYYSDQPGWYNILRLVAQTGKYATHGIVQIIINKLIESTKYGHDFITLIGPQPGTNKNILHVSYTCKIIESLLKYSIHSLPRYLDISSSDSITVEDTAKIIMDRLGVQKKIIWTSTTWTEDNPIVKLKSTLLDSPTSKESIELTLDDYIREQKDINNRP